MRELNGNSQMRGRNGWFKPKWIGSWGGVSSMNAPDQPTVEVSIYSKSIGEHAPIWMWLTLEDAQEMAEQITSAIADAQSRAVQAKLVQIAGAK